MWVFLLVEPKGDWVLKRVSGPLNLGLSIALSLCDIYTQRLVNVLGTTSLLNLFCMRSKVITMVNILESVCVGVCFMFEKSISKYVKVNYGGTHT
jgi:hypothetical protein